MYCSNRGNKLEENDIFCSECGKKREDFKKSNSKKRNKKPIALSKRAKNLVLIIVIFITFIFLYKVLDNTLFSEEQTIKKYVTAYSKNDYNTIINLSDINRNEFMSKETILKKYGEKTDEFVNVKILSDNKNKKEHTRTIQYYKIPTEKNIINLSIKEAGNKYLLFKNYVITSNNLTAENIEITIPKDTNLIVDDVEMNNKYQTKETSKKKVYKIKEVLSKNVLLQLKLQNDITITSVRNFFDNESITIDNFYNNKLDDKSKKIVEDKIDKAVTNIVKSALEGKEFSEMNSTEIYTDTLLKSTAFSTNYNNLKEKLKVKNVKNFSIKKINISNIYLNSNNINIIEFNAKITYNYQNETNQEVNSSRNVKILLDNSLNLKVHDILLSNLQALF